MSLLHLKPRPIPSRDKNPDRLRDDRLFIIACDDTYAPDQYFKFFKLTRVHIHVVPTQDGTSVAAAVLARLLEFKHDDDDERWMLLDTDHLTQGTHLPGLVRALRDAEDKGVRVALSKGGVIPNANTSRVYLIWKAIASKAFPSQFPVELHGLLQQRSEEIAGK